ncbi:L-threonylcarbamoyladenylate synthase [Paenibacillus alginolyticus]|uniref:Threonylcarbamoyl-AMP synthase n=1 Tax=Paenibacillus alginolyticus TaxID=59839 RepID=A0ABT4GGQ4_9BACL|nr:L-threonylcarbamoyladenylate synthase [Paenibacillus alginolyticus]MCY9695374.1 L-threonylcarbamoyladenylate synthase [Paenibacillus alginolyticus]MEC0144484.1 L-threonylcarbamoyladenylate synthase [Paenibacillus alginolyticus]
MIVTKYWKVDQGIGTEIGIELAEAAQLLRSGETVAFPTETVYGLGADATNTAAVEGIFTAKGRPSDNPLIVHIANVEQLSSLILSDRVSADHRQLMEVFWPGPLTIVLPVKTGGISPLVTAGLKTVGVRIPDHPVALQLLREAGLPIAAPSANSSGRPSPTLASHVRDDLDGRIGGIVDGGATGVGVESTVIELVGGELYILRPGGVTAEQLQSALPAIRIHEPERGEVQGAETPRAPGMKYTHYAPKGFMHIVQGEDAEAVAEWIQHDIDAAKTRGESTGILTFEERASRYHADLVIACGLLSQPETIAQDLYAALRQFDQEGIQYIAAEGCPETGIGLAIMNRLRKAAGHRLVRV